MSLHSLCTDNMHYCVSCLRLFTNYTSNWLSKEMCKQWWSTIQSISTHINHIHLKSLKQWETTYDIRNPARVRDSAQNHGGVKPFNGIPTAFWYLNLIRTAICTIFVLNLIDWLLFNIRLYLRHERIYGQSTMHVERSHRAKLIGGRLCRFWKSLPCNGSSTTTKQQIISY